MSRNNSVSIKNKKTEKTVVSDSESDADENESVCEGVVTSDEEEGFESEGETQTQVNEKSKTKENRKKNEEKKTKMKAPRKTVEKKDSKKPSQTASKKRKKVETDFDDTDVSIDMTREAVSVKKIKLQSNLMLVRRMIHVDEGGKKWSYPGLVFVRKMKDSKAFEFNLPIAISDNLVEAIKVLNNKDEPPSSKLKQ